ncbi:MAG: cytochrome c family protein [Parvularculaceae bacterium]
MDSYEANKIAAAILTALLLGLGLRVLAEELFHPHELEEPAYRVEIAEAGGAAAEEEEVDFATLIATANVAAGERRAAVCRSCHTFGKGEPHRQGPNLYGVVGRPVGAQPGFNYSPAMSSFGGEWTYERLFHFLENSQGYVEGTAMIQRVRNPEDRANIIAYLRCNSDAPPPPPETEEPVDNPTTC